MAVIFYLLFIVGTLFFVVVPGLESDSRKAPLLLAALFGLIMYATYDQTNLAAITATAWKELDPFALIGFLVWALGLGIEVIADAQKSRFNADPANKDKFIQPALWSCPRHPNYFGEIVLWIGVTVIALPLLQGWKWVA